MCIYVYALIGFVWSGFQGIVFLRFYNVDSAVRVFPQFLHIWFFCPKYMSVVQQQGLNTKQVMFKTAMQVLCLPIICTIW